ncbi:MAG: ADP-ribosylglycohydrolase family protein [Acidimicrobiales bacterium]
MGAVVGDALGAPLEGHRGPVPPSRLTYLEDDEGSGSPLRYTDDTAMTMALAGSLVGCAGLDQDHLARCFGAAFKIDPDRGYGAGTADLLARVAAGARWQEAVSDQFGGAGSLGNGAAMRVAPVALYSCGDLLRVGELARRSAAVTHAHPAAIEGAVAQAVAVALALAEHSGVPLDRSGFLDGVVGAVAPGDTATSLRALTLLVRDEDRLRPGVVASVTGTGVAAHESVPAALAAFLVRPGSVAEAVRFAISLGGDTDTIASMAGAIAGAYHGAARIPRQWMDRVEGVHAMTALADRLHQGAQASARAGTTRYGAFLASGHPRGWPT